jgi:prophage maintenance system killer protein
MRTFVQHQRTPIFEHKQLSAKAQFYLESANSRGPDDDDDNNVKLQAVSDFLRKHHAIRTLHNSYSNSDGADPEDKSDFTTVYMQVLEQFQTSQLDRQTTSLTGNNGRADAATAQKIVEQHQAALRQSLSLPSSSASGSLLFSNTDDSLTVAKLNVLQSLLCDGLSPDAGMVRRKNVRAGDAASDGHETVAQTLWNLMKTLEQLRHRFLVSTPTTASDAATGPADTSAPTVDAASVVSYATAVFCGILDVHPYSDGNDRLARIAMNWVLLRQCKFPFSVQLFANPTQQAEHSDAVRQALRNIDLVPRGTATEDDVRRTLAHFGCLRPVTSLLLDRMHRAVTEFNGLVQDKLALHHEQAEARAARTFRERAAASTCLICFDDHPNVATLCCGKAVHMNCMAEWLSANSSCPQCRGVLPPIPARVLLRAGNVSYNNETSDETGIDEGEDNSLDGRSTDDDSSTGVQWRDIYADADAYSTGSSDNAVSLESMVAGFRRQQQERANNQNSYNNDDEMEEDTISDDDDYGLDSVHDSSNDDASSTEWLTTSNARRQQQQQSVTLLCTHCTNRAARDCTNAACSQCCLVHGDYECGRHSYQDS